MYLLPPPFLFFPLSHSGQIRAKRLQDNSGRKKALSIHMECGCCGGRVWVWSGLGNKSERHCATVTSVAMSAGI